MYDRNEDVILFDRACALIDWHKANRNKLAESIRDVRSSVPNVQNSFIRNLYRVPGEEKQAHTKPTAANFRMFAEGYQGFAQSPVTGIPQSEYYSHCGLEDAAIEARRDAEREARDYALAARMLALEEQMN